jgi:ACR3 family arsenite efflux pump ArsB
VRGHDYDTAIAVALNVYSWPSIVVCLDKCGPFIDVLALVGPVKSV